MAGLAEAIEVHASPEAFIASRLARNNNMNAAGDGSTINTKILNRNVAIVTSYETAKKTLTEASHESFSVTMDLLFPSPDLTASDGCPNHAVRGRWRPAFEALAGEHSDHQAIARQWFSELPLTQEVQLYRTMKFLAWRLVLVPTLGVSPGGPQAREIQSLQQDILRGQFSKIPVSVNAGIWQSARHKGIQAREQLQQILRQRLQTRRPPWLPANLVESHLDEVISQLLVMTSSLIVKSLASLLTALFLNFYLHEPTTSSRIDARLDVLLEETMRLCPPLVGVMRRSTVAGAEDKVPKGWVLWAYLAGANRDANVFGQDAKRFRPERYTDTNTPAPLTLGVGDKQCPGIGFVKSCCIATLESCQKLDIKMKGAEVRPGVQAWLGWKEASPEVWAKDMKQLPTQRPSEPVMVQFSRGYSEHRMSYDR